MKQILFLFLILISSPSMAAEYGKFQSVYLNEPLVYGDFTITYTGTTADTVPENKSMDAESDERNRNGRHFTITSEKYNDGGFVLNLDDKGLAKTDFKLFKDMVSQQFRAEYRDGEKLAPRGKIKIIMVK